MTNFQNPNSKKDIEIIKKIYSGINRNDIDSVLELVDSNIFRIEFENETYQGHAGMRDIFAAGRSKWAEGACEPIEFFSEGNKVVVDVHVKVRLKNESKWIDAHVADGFAFKNGLVSEFHSFSTKEKAFAWAGFSKI